MDIERRRELNQALAKAIAFEAQGNHAEARNWAARLMLMLAHTFPIGGDNATAAKR